MITPTQGFTNLLMEILTDYARILFAEVHNKPRATLDAWCNELLARVEQDGDLRLDLFYILVAFGCPGGVNVIAYLRAMQSPLQSAVA